MKGMLETGSNIQLEEKNNEDYATIIFTALYNNNRVWLTTRATRFNTLEFVFILVNIYTETACKFV